MPEFQVPADIGNRALQHLGQRQMSAALGFSENTKNATETSFAYGKLREAELHRNSWRFAIRRQILRAIDTNTLIVKPALFVQATTYFRGSIVADGNNNLWISNQPNNLGNDPLASTAWDPYFGPLTVALYDSTQSYYTGELVYTAAGDGTVAVFLSLVTGNVLDPSLPNQWNATTTYFKNQVVQSFPAWSSLTTYSQGQTITYTDGNTYTSLINSNLNNIPPNTINTDWALMPVLSLQSVQVPANPQTSATPISPLQTSPVYEWASSQSYSIGNFVMFDGNEYVSLVNNNIGNYPNAAASTSWAEVTNGTLYMSLIDLNTNNAPASNSPAAWSGSTSYSIGNQVTASDGLTYTSKINSNLNNNPAGNAFPSDWTQGPLTAWTTTFTQGGGNQQWLQIGGTAFPSGVSVGTPNIVYPLGTGPATDLSTSNIFHLPAGYLRRAPRDPKAGSQSQFGAPTNLFVDDWEFEGDYIVSRESNPIVFRFVANVTDVRKMDPMFCEALAADIAKATCETLTQSTAKKQIAQQEYDRAIGMAALQNGIEVGGEEPVMDDWLAVRY